ncbi:MAG: hypothetical protein JKY37_24765 [Nannocystaceae bacterium]|nr:hypothetical protein [Nannocystaceae bacterium]
MMDHYLATRVALISVCLLGANCVAASDDDLDTAAFEDEASGTADDAQDGELRTYEGWLGSALGASVVTGSTKGKNNEFDATCVKGIARDVSYTWTAPSTASYTFTTAGSNFDTVLHIRSFADSSETLGCDDNSGGATHSAVSVALTEGTTVIIVVDGPHKSEFGKFALGIYEQCPDGCTDPPTQCAADIGQCSVGPGQPQGVCSYPPVFPGTACDDGSDCSAFSSCWGYSCIPYDWCDFGPECHERLGQCENGTCSYDPEPKGEACDDGITCSEDDVCDGAGTCVGGTDTCEDGEMCTPSGCESSPCGGYQDCGYGACCEWGSNCSVCVS